MKCIVIVNNDAEQLKKEKKFFQLKYKDAEIVLFTDPFMAVKFILNNNVDRIYSEVILKPVSGFILLKVLRKNIPDVQVYLISDGNGFREDAMRASANGYVMREEMLSDI